MKVFALLRNLTVKAGELSDTTPPAVRPFLLTTQRFVETPQFVQGVFQRLGVLFLFTRAQVKYASFMPDLVWE